MVMRYRGPGTAAAADVSEHPAMAGARPTSTSKSAPASPIAEARQLLDSERCVWCEQRPRLAASMLCVECARHDPDGVFAAPAGHTHSATR